MRFPRQLIASIVSIALICVPLSACTPDASTPTTLAPLSPTPTPGPATTLPEPLTAPAPIAQAAPVLSTEAKEQTAAGAKAFVRHYFAVVDYAYATGDTAPLAAISDPKCLPCEQIMKQVNQATAKSLTYVRSSTTLIDISEPLGEAMDSIQIDVIYSTSGFSLVDDSGLSIATVDAVTNQKLGALIIWSGSGWLVRHYTEVS